jgi:hypothetical protein
MLEDLDVRHYEVLDASVVVAREVYCEIPRRRWALNRFSKDVWLTTPL